MFQTLQAFISRLRNAVRIEKQIFYIDELIQGRLKVSAQNCLKASFGCGGCQAIGLGVDFMVTLFLYTNLSFKEMSEIEREAYNRRHNMRSHILIRSIHSVGIISPALVCGYTLGVHTFITHVTYYVHYVFTFRTQMQNVILRHCTYTVKHAAISCFIILLFFILFR